jgi:hypothetical protein
VLRIIHAHPDLLFGALDEAAYFLLRLSRGKVFRKKLWRTHFHFLKQVQLFFHATPGHPADGRIKFTPIRGFQELLSRLQGFVSVVQI